MSVDKIKYSKGKELLDKDEKLLMELIDSFQQGEIDLKELVDLISKQWWFPLLPTKKLSDFGPMTVIEPEFAERVKKLHLPKEDEDLLLHLVAFYR